MALLVDGDINRIEDLREWDTTVLEVANGEGIDLEAKLRLAAKEIEEEVESFLKWQERGQVGQVQVSTPLKRWHALVTLSAVYRDAYFSQLNDRYGERWKHYTELAAAQERRYFDIGVATVSAPVRRPERLETALSDGSAAAATYWMQATVVDAAGRESAPGRLVMVSSPLPHGLTAWLPYTPAGATHWNVYVTQSDGAPGLQNATPMAVSESWTLPATGIAVGRPAGDGQAADGVVTRGGQFRRG
jgi:hypothetical protein